MFCCAADASPVWILVETEGEGPVENDRWVRFEGIVDPKEIQGRTVPLVLDATVTWLPKPPPGEQYLFPPPPPRR
jgi:uncharacterized membrane protein YcgQ (UPF0703/DUF1980 family)